MFQITNFAPELLQLFLLVGRQAGLLTLVASPLPLPATQVLLYVSKLF